MEAAGWSHFDDVVFKIAAGGLALSVTFLGVTKEVNPASMPWVFGSWGALTFALLILLLSICSAQIGLRTQIANWDAETYYGNPHPEGSTGRLTPWLNALSAAACIVGLIGLVGFAVVNLRSRTTMTQKADSSSVDVNKGVVSPQAPRPAATPASNTGATNQSGNSGSKK